MPKKACCCNQISWPTSCCKPPEASCVGSDINISVDIYVKFYCQPNGNILIWNCSNGSQNSIEFEMEHWRLTLTYSLSEDDVAPKIPSLTYQTRSGTYNYYVNEGGTANPSWGVSYWGAFGYVGGFVDQRLYGNTAGEFPINGGCQKCIDPCDAAGKIKGCKNFSYSDDTGQIITGCGIPFQYQLFPPLYYYTVVNCDACCNESYETLYDNIDLSAKYNACDNCGFGGSGRANGAYALGVKTIDGGTYSNNALDTNISLRDDASWSFEFIPSYDGHISKLNIDLLSCHFGCSTSSNMYLYDAFIGYVYKETEHLTDFYPTLNPIPRYYDNICLFDYDSCGISSANPNLVDQVCLTMTQYYNPPTTIGLTCSNLPPCGCIAGGPNNCNGNVGEITQGFYIPNRYFLTNCGCTCEDKYSCYRWFHRSADPDQIRRPHELSIELGIGYRDVIPCGDHVEMDFYEELYFTDVFDPDALPIKIEKVLTSSNGVKYVNPEWTQGVLSAGAEEFINGYNYYSQGMRMKLTYTRNSIPHEKYVYNNVENNCVPTTIAGGITGFTAQNKIYPEYPKQGHPNMFEHPQGIYEGEYALSKISYWTPSVNATVDIASAPPPPGGWARGQTYGKQQEDPPVDVSAFNRCYPFNTPFLSQEIYIYPYNNAGALLNTNNPISKQAYPITYQYSYGDITAIVTQS